jgi:hypothetical protein
MKTDTPRQLRVLLAILYMAIMVFLQEARDIVVAMTGNADYPTPVPPLAEVTSALDDLQAKIEAAAGGDRTAMAARNAAWVNAKGLVRQLAGYVQCNCKNDLTILLSSGFKATKTPSPIGPLQPPQNLRASYTGVSGQVKLSMNPVYGVRAGYTVQLAESVAGPYTEIAAPSNTRDIKVSNLTPGKSYWLRAAANGAAGQSGWSNPVGFMAV